MGRILAVTAAGLALLLVGITVVMGGGTVAVAGPPAGGCTVALRAGNTGGPAPDGGVVQREATLDADQLAVARLVVVVGKGLQVDERGIAIALAVAMQESSLDPAAVNGRSVGLFQQQGQLYAGVDRADPAAAAAAFYRVLLQRVPHYADPAAVGFAEAAQAVPASGAGAMFYARWQAWATALARRLIHGTAGQQSAAGVVCRVGGGAGPIPIIMHGLRVQLPLQAGLAGTLTFPNQRAATAAAAALSYLGTRYAWGGGSPNGPTLGQRDGGVGDAFGDFATVGFDCSGLMLFAYAQAGITLPRTSRAQQSAGARVPWSQAQPGDLLFWGAPVHHVALYLGQLDGQHYLVEAPHSGAVVRVSVVRTGGDFTGSATRPS